MQLYVHKNYIGYAKQEQCRQTSREIAVHLRDKIGIHCYVYVCIDIGVGRKHPKQFYPDERTGAGRFVTAKAVQDRLYSYLWDNRRDACYDRNRNNEFMPALQHNNLRAMYYGVFSQKMADRFVNEHLRL